MTEPSTAWQKDSDDLYFAARGLAEHRLAKDLKEIGHTISPRELVTVRLAIAAAVSSSISVLVDAGWMRTEPHWPLAKSDLVPLIEQSRPRLEKWEDDLGGDW